MGNNKMRKAVFLDRDGVLNPTCGKDTYDNPESPLRLEDYHLFFETPQMIRQINQMGFLAIVVTNQPAVAKGKMKLADLEKMHNLLLSETEKASGKIEKIFTCLHHPDPKQVVFLELLKNCDCRKPKPGMILSAATEFNIDLKKSWMVGDSWRDIAAGKSAGCQTILVAPTEENFERYWPDYMAENLKEATVIINKLISEEVPDV